MSNHPDMGGGGSQSHAIALLDRYHKGSLRAYISPAARIEQGLEPLWSEGDRALAERLLRAPRERMLSALQSVVPAHAAQILDQVLRVPRRPAGLTVVDYRPYLQRDAESVRWLLVGVAVGLTGVTMSTSIWAGWTRRDAGDDIALPKPLLFWEGWADMTDYLGTHYRSPGMSAPGWGPEPVSSSWWRGYRVGIQHVQTFFPGPPMGARSLRLTALPRLTREMPSTRGWVRQEVLLQDATVSIDLARREWILAQQDGN